MKRNSAFTIMTVFSFAFLFSLSFFGNIENLPSVEFNKSAVFPAYETNQAGIASGFLNFLQPAEKDALGMSAPPAQLGKFVPITGNLDQMKKFFNSLKDLSKTKVRIAHYGDSLLLGDVITEYLRNRMQERFGGKGAGYLSVVSSDIAMRVSTKISFSSDWESVSIVTRNPKNLPLGINGWVSIPSVNSWVKYVCGTEIKSCTAFDVVRVFYSNADNTSQIEYKINGGKPQKVNLSPGQNVQELTVQAGTVGNSFEMKFLGGKAPYFYGVSLESWDGMYVDNFPISGNSGVSLLEISDNMYKDFQSKLNYKLIILNYGANVQTATRGIYTLYENKMVSVIERYKKIFPDAAILLVSVADKTFKQGSNFVTNPEVPLLLEAQKRIAKKTNIAFWNLWEAMGGRNSMTDWVNAAPPMALKDYSHFNQLGGERVSELLMQALMDAYDKSNK